MFKINIIYSEQFEVNRVVNTLRELDWFQKNKYKITLPANLIRPQSDDVLVEKIKEAVRDEFDESFYQKQKDFIFKNWEKSFSQIVFELNKTGLSILDEYKIFLTRYGTGGSYHFPDEVIINIEFISKDNLLQTAIHEIVHLIIEPLISSYHINHWPKERLVDLIISRIAPSLVNFQYLPINTDDIDNIFIKNYPKIKQIFQDIAKLDNGV